MKFQIKHPFNPFHAISNPWSDVLEFSPLRLAIKGFGELQQASVHSSFLPFMISFHYQGLITKLGFYQGKPLSTENKHFSPLCVFIYLQDN
jgi:hypothetical protein